MTANAAPSAKPYLQIQGLVKKFGDNYAVDHIDLDIEQHEIFALLGSSGSGKSTLLRMLAGMETPNQGKIILDTSTASKQSVLGAQEAARRAMAGDVSGDLSAD